ncbi:hypothetical protein STSP_66710 [Streptomyces jeddahensis]|uniref:Uncharacterized protein n=1 Tax=Streptomyces jeddahensis TaxID=1716141 RepID=A0A177HGV8_9ACTN|nr:hypothetical protein STSP_66710 [Streptomyces jeddahensis]
MLLRPRPAQRRYRPQGGPGLGVSVTPAAAVVEAAGTDRTARPSATPCSIISGRTARSTRSRDPQRPGFLPVAELTGLRDLTGRPTGMRLIVRRLKPSRRDAKKLTAFEKHTGRRYRILATKIPAHHGPSLEVLAEEHRLGAGRHDRRRPRRLDPAPSEERTAPPRARGSRRHRSVTRRPVPTRRGTYRAASRSQRRVSPRKNRGQGVPGRGWRRRQTRRAAGGGPALSVFFGRLRSSIWSTHRLRAAGARRAPSIWASPCARLLSTRRRRAVRMGPGGSRPVPSPHTRR